MAIRIQIEVSDLRAAVNGILEEYGDDAAEAIEKSATKVAKDVVKELKKGGAYNGGEDFNKGWTSQTTPTRLGTTAVVYNKTKPGLAHLLEFGHAKRNGGRTRAFNFIAPVADTIEQRFIDELNDTLGG